MTTAKIAANQRNALRSTGPKTAAGKAVARLNATAHGLRAAAQVVPGEILEVWQAFRDAIVADLAPVGVLETELADRVALLHWRLRRVGAFEAGMVARASDLAAVTSRGVGTVEPAAGYRTATGPMTPAVVRAEMASAGEAIRDRIERARLLAELAATPDGGPFDGSDAMFLLDALIDSLTQPDPLDEDELEQLATDPHTDPAHPTFLTAVGVPPADRDEPDEWDGWSAAVRAGVRRVAGSVGWTADVLLARAAADAATGLKRERKRLAALKKELPAAERRADEDEAAARRRALVPPEAVVGTVVKYEGHLQRQLTQTLHELERRQALRSGFPLQPPAAVDVTIHAADDRAATLLPFGG